MAKLPDDAIAELDGLLQGAERSLSRLGELSDADAERVGARMDRLASQLLEVSAPPSMDDVHRRLGTTPASDADFESLLDEMAPADSDG